MTKEKRKKPFYKKWWVWLLAIIIIAGLLGGEEEDTDDNEASSDNTVTEDSPNEDQDSNDSTGDTEEDVEEDTTEEEIVEVGIGVPATIADVSFTVNSVDTTQEISSGNEFIDPATTEGQFIIVDITVKNDKKEAITINSSYFKLVTSDDVEYEPTTDGEVSMAMMDEDSFFLEQVNPGLSKTGKVVFEVGLDLDLSQTILKGQTGFWGTETVEISLAN